MKKKIVSAALTVLLAVAVFVPTIARSAKAASVTCRTYRVTDAEEQIIKQQAKEYIAAMHCDKERYALSLPQSLWNKFDKQTLCGMVEVTAFQEAPFMVGRYFASRFSIKRYFSDNGAGFLFEPLLTDAQVKETENAAKAAVSDLINQPLTDRKKVQGVYDRLAKSCSFDTDFSRTIDERSETAYGALVRHKAVCCGESMAFCLMCHYAGIPNVAMREGYLSQNGKVIGGHAWDTFTENGKTYIIDSVNYQCLKESVKDVTYRLYKNGTEYLLP